RSSTLPNGFAREQTQRLAHYVNGTGDHDHASAAGEHTRALKRSWHRIRLQNLRLSMRSEFCDLFWRRRAWVLRPRRNHAISQREKNVGNLADGLVPHRPKNECQRPVFIKS